MAALDAAGHFRRGNNNNNNSKNKKGTVNVAAGAGKDDDNNKSEDDTTKSKDSNTSGLTEDMTIGELLRLTGVINTTAGMKETDGTTTTTRARTRLPSSRTATPADSPRT